jgi:alpha-1,3-mannosyltransferase
MHIMSIKGYFNDWRFFPKRILVILVSDLILNTLIIKAVSYTEIDWTAYVQEVECWLGGDNDYMNLKGDTGPLVYPAGYVYVFAALRWLTGTGRGADAIRIAQWTFLGISVATTFVVMFIYKHTKPGPPWIIVLLVLSKRVHSLYVLRLFNDCIAMLFAYVFVYAYVNRRWIVGICSSASL